MNQIQSSLVGLSDVEGVMGSFVIMDTGALVGSNMPAVFDEQVFAEAGPRIARLLEASSGIAEGLRTCVLRFAEHKLFIRRIEGAFLGVVLSAASSVPALKVATNIVARRIASALASGLTEPPAPVTARSEALPSPPTPPSVRPAPPQSSAVSVQPSPASAVSVQPSPPKSGPPSFYRGRRVG